MVLDPSAERERVRSKYPPVRGRDLALMGLGFVVLLVAGHFVDVGWQFYAGMVIGLIAWEATKFRLRRNADRFATPPS